MKKKKPLIDPYMSKIYDEIRGANYGKVPRERLPSEDEIGEAEEAREEIFKTVMKELQKKKYSSTDIQELKYELWRKLTNQLVDKSQVPIKDLLTYIY